MAHFAFIAPPLPGHYNPLLALARVLIARGHRATFVHQPDAARLIGDAEVGFHAIGAESHPPGSLDRWTRPMSKLNGFVGLPAMIRETAAQTDMICRDAPGAMSALGIDAILCDQMEPGGALVAGHLGIPFASVANGLLINREPTIPPPYVAWPYDPSERGIRRNIGGYRVSDLLMRRAGDVIARHAAHFGLAPRRRADQCLSPLLQISQAVAGLDFPRRALPPAFHYLGPFRDPDIAGWTLPDADDRPLVYCSLGTLMGARVGVFRRIAAVCRDLGLRLLLVHCGLLSSEQVAALPGDPLVYDFVPQRAVIAHAALVITHAGFNTVIDALDLGVPMIAIPLAFEQPATAARLARAGVAEVLSPRFSERSLREAITKMLGDPSYRENSRRLAAEIAAAGGAARAADLIEALLVSPADGPGASTRADAARGDARGDSRSESR